MRAVRASAGFVAVASVGAITPLSWDDAYVKATATLGQMTSEEKYSMMKGAGAIGKWGYVGNTPPIHRLGIPALSMQDNADGFRTTEEDLVGTVTAWPSLLAYASTFNRQTVRTWAEALGEEFVNKGANMILGPSVNVHRVARGGRNFEYLSGDDPFLGAELVKPYIAGLDFMGVMTVVKHFTFNSQETHRNPSLTSGPFNAIVDDKTAWELYYPPFQSAVDAGASAFMCAYNMDDGEYSCSNSKRLKEDLKGTMGFKGFVQSDWGATHATSVEAGLDQDMPGTDGFFSPDNLAKVNSSAIDESVTRILAAMYRSHVFETNRCDPSANCTELFKSDVRGEHAELATAAATEAIVLLKNDGVLPLAPASTKKIAIVGSAAAAQQYDPNTLLHKPFWNVGDYYSGGGSGHVVGSPDDLVTPLAGIQKRAAAAGIEVVVSASDSVRAAQKAAKEADVTIVVAGASCGEAKDRKSLSLDNSADDLIEAVAGVTNRTVVLAMAPGAFLTPWRDDVAALVTVFLAGQATGTAFASIIFGDHAPSGRLPIMLPASEDDTILPGKGDVPYSEGLATSYRNSVVTPAFPFGHGLTYSTFDYSASELAPCEDSTDMCVSVGVTNTGYAAANAVVQLYLELSAEAGHPAPFLKGFEKTGLLQPGASESVTFRLSERLRSFWKDGNWVKAESVTAHIGESSADIRLSLSSASATFV